jgi:putative endonuclease
MTEGRARRGELAYQTGLAAEAGVARHYARAGCEIIARRWRGRAGEIDLIGRDADGFVFVEVKAAHTLAQAAERLTRRQMARLAQAAEEFLASVSGRIDQAMRFDVALVDRTGRLEVCRNALMAD